MKLIFRWLLLFGSGILLASSTARTAEISNAAASKAAIDRGTALIEVEDYTAAIKQFSELLRSDHKIVPALIGRGSGYRMLGKFDLALADFDAALRVEPNNSEAHRGRAAVYAEKKAFEKAFAECEQAIRCDAKNAAAYRTRGQVHSEKGESERAIADYNRALQMNPKDHWSLLDRAIEQMNHGQTDKAISDLTEAIRISPVSIRLLCNRGAAYRCNGEWDKAIADFTAAISLKPKDPDLFIFRAETWLQGKMDFNRTVSDADEAIKLNPRSSLAHRLRGLANNYRGEPDKALADFDSAIRLDPKDYEAFTYRGIVDLVKGDVAKARADFAKSLAINPTFPTTYRLRGQISANDEKFDEAISDFTRAIELQHTASDYFIRGTYYEKKGNASKAEVDFNKWRELSLNGVMIERGLAKASAAKQSIRSVEQHIRDEVKGLEYSDEVAQQVVSLVHDWNLATLQEKLSTATSEHELGKLSKEKLVQAQRNNAEILCQELAAVVRYKKESAELDEVVRGKCACCMGYSLIYYALGRSIGLDVRGLDVPSAAGGPTVDGDGHMACHVQLADGQVMLVDAAGPYVSTPFDFAAAYRAKGSYWELKASENPPGLHRLVRPLDRDGLVAAILICRASALSAKGDSNGAYSQLADAIGRNPAQYRAYDLQGLLHYNAGSYDFAITDFNTAIRHNPLNEHAYLYRAASFWAKSQIDRAITDYNEAIRINPKFAAAYAARAAARLSVSQSEAFNAWSPNIPSYPTPAARAYATPATGNQDVPPPPSDWSTDSAAPASPSVPYPVASSMAYGQPMPTAPALTPTPSVTPFRTNGLPPTLAEVDVLRARVEKYWGTIKRGQDQALADYCEAIRLDPQNAGYRKGRAAIYAARGENEKHLADLSEAIRLDPKDYNALAERCRVYEARGDIDKAIADATEGIRKQTGPSTIYIYSRRADLYGRKGDIDKAIADLTEAIRNCPSYRQAYEHRAEFYSQKHETEKAAVDAAHAARIPSYGSTPYSPYATPSYSN